jgi:hypothetical protein
LPGRRLVIRPAETDEWQADRANVERLLESTAGVLWRHFPERRLPPILVEPRDGPIALFRRLPDGEIQVRLNTGGKYWSQYAFQFSHEFCHILSNFDEDENPNRWFEESLCETASLFAMRRMAEDWKTDPPYSNWRDYAPALRQYADARIGEAPLPAGKTFAEWFRENEGAMRENACLREATRVVAGVLLPLFEERPERWEAIGWLNAGKSYKTQSLADYLADWRYYAPERHRAIIGQIAERFGVAMP